MPENKNSLPKKYDNTLIKQNEKYFENLQNLTSLQTKFSLFSTFLQAESLTIYLKKIRPSKF